MKVQAGDDTPMTMPVGYLVAKGGLFGVWGTHYSYIMAGNGLFVEADGRFLWARVQLAQAKVRGLSALEPGVRLKHGKVLPHCWELLRNTLASDPSQEKYGAIIWDSVASQYRLWLPSQEASSASVTYEKHPDAVIELHSHGGMPAFFSGQDDSDEQGLGIYGVIGGLWEAPEYQMRVGVYGHFAEVSHWTVFEASPLKLEEANELRG